MQNPGLLDRAVIRLSGEDVRGFLQGLVTHDMVLVEPGAPQWAGLLTPQGKALFDFILWADGDDILIDCEAGQVEALILRLMLYRLRRKISIAVDEGLHVAWEPSQTVSPEPVEGRLSADTRASTGSALRVLDTAPDPRHPALGTRMLAAETIPAAEEPWRAHRLSLGITEGVAEMGSDKTLWLECNAAELNGVSFTKGCYVGQENTARMNWRAKVNRRLVTVPLAEADDRRVTARYPDLDLAVQLMRIEDINRERAPDWLRAALEKQQEQ